MTVEVLSQVLSNISALIQLLIVTVVVYQENHFKTKKGWCIYFLLYIAMMPVLLILSNSVDILLLELFIFYELFIIINRKNKKIRGMVLIIPCMGLASSLEMLPNMIVRLIFGENLSTMIAHADLLAAVYDIGMIFLLYLLLKKSGIPWERRVIGKGQRRLFNVTGILFIIIYCLVLETPEGLGAYDRYIQAAGIVITMIVLVQLILVISENSRANYYLEAARLNEQYLDVQYKYFKRYQKQQADTRRIRHDIKNHLLCMKELCRNKQYEELQQYLEDIEEMTTAMDAEFRTGNDIADAIINIKNETVKKQGIQFEIEGRMTNDNGIQQIDICTIFSNAVDNAVEALQCLDEQQEKRLYIEVKQNKHFLYLLFKNQCSSDTKADGITTKKDRNNHGFGMENIRQAAAKYNGSVECQVLPDDNKQTWFCLEIMLNNSPFTTNI